MQGTIVSSGAFAELHSILQHQPLLPRLKTLVLSHGWSHSARSHMMISTLLTPCITTLKIEFSHTPPSHVVEHILESIRHKSNALQYLTIHRRSHRTRCPHGLESGLTNLFANSVLFWRSMLKLNMLSLDPDSITVQLLDTIGDLPDLRSLYASCWNGSGSESVKFPEANLEKRTAKFPRLKNLRLSINSESLKKLMDTYFQSQTSIIDLRLRIADDSAEPTSFNFITAFNKIQILQLDLGQIKSQPPIGDWLTVLTKCNRLTKLQIDVWQRLTFERHQLSTLLESCGSITVLILLEKREVEASGVRSSTNSANAPFRPPLGLGLDLSCLDIISQHLHKLKDLRLSIVACDTSSLLPDSKVTRMKTLKRLQLKTSFMNWKFDGFKCHHASRYISAIISPAASFEMLSLNLKNFPGVWKSYASGYNTFLSEFKELVENYI